MMALKSTFMNEIYELKKELSLSRSLDDRNESKEPDKIVILPTFWRLNLYFLKKKIQFYVRSLKLNKK